MEEFIVILVNAEYGLGYSSMKLLRSLYEHALTAEFIAHDPKQAELFYNYCPRDALKFRNRALKVYPGRWNDSAQPAAENQEWWNKVKDHYKVEPCPECGQKPQMAWSTLSLEALADRVDKISNKRFDENSESNFKRAYLVCAELTNPHIHASMFAIVNRLASDGDQYSYKSSQDVETDMALSTSHGLMSLVADTQDRYFKLGLSERLQKFCRDCFDAWQCPATTSERST